MPRWALIENYVLYGLTVVLLLGLYALGAGAWSFWALVLLLWANTPKGKSDD